ncbi:zinc finger protein OZF-like isoform X1 [Pieris napi]|uniref:zinc finger protein OZF-like isoform X1 n=1 Tax=Pieris napi TaxID=78633 RepID=UPI001FB863D2|nr:zinc finger protein OZF-like isoform X1 [Pieris napi]
MAQHLELQFNLNSSEYFMQEDFCQLCLFKIGTGALQITQCITEKIKECLDLDFTEEFPNRICKVCEIKIKQFYDFKQTCQDSYRKFRDFLANKPIKIESHQDDDSDNTHFEEELSSEPEIKPIVIETMPIAIETEPIVNDTKLNVKDTKQVKKRIRKKRSDSWCYVCLIDFKTSEYLNKHREEHHENSITLYKCLGCEKGFRNRRLCLSHERLFCRELKNGYKCNICNILLPTRRKYENHDQQHKSNVKVEAVEYDVFQCDLCRLRFGNEGKLINHLKKHDNPTRYVCETCGRVFQRRDYLYKHTFIHNGLKKYACTCCAYKTNQKSALNIHMRTHTGIKPFGCDICSYRTVSSGNLKAHRQKHSSSKQYECSVCDKKFVYKKSLEVHISCAHAPQHHICDCGALYTSAKSLKRHLATKQCGAKSDKYIL